MVQTKDKKRLDYVDFANIAAAFAVICLHCSGGVFDYAEERRWYLALLIQTVMHFAVPVFFMLTGTILLEYRRRYTTRTFFKKRALRTGIPFLFWTVVYLFSPVIMYQASLPDLAAVRNAFLNNGATNIFWFFYALFGIYLAMPVLSLLAKPENFRQIEYLCALSFVFNALLPVFTRYVGPVYGELKPAIVGGYFGYVFLGWLIRHEQYSKKTRLLIYAAGASGALLMFFGTWALARQSGETNTFFMEYNSVACFPMSAALLLWFKHIPWQKVYRFIPQRFVTKAAGAGLGVYVMHMLVLQISEKYGWFDNHPMYGMLFMPFLIYIFCVLLTCLLQKIPIVRHLIP